MTAPDADALRDLAERLPLIADLWDEMRAELRRGGTIYPGDISPDDTGALRLRYASRNAPESSGLMSPG